MPNDVAEIKDIFRTFVQYKDKIIYIFRQGWNPTHDINYDDQGHGVYLVGDGTILLNTEDGEFKISRKLVKTYETGAKDYEYKIEVISNGDRGVLLEGMDTENVFGLSTWIRNLISSPTVTWEGTARALTCTEADSAHSPDDVPWGEVRRKMVIKAGKTNLSPRDVVRTLIRLSKPSFSHFEEFDQGINIRPACFNLDVIKPHG